MLQLTKTDTTELIIVYQTSHITTRPYSDNPYNFTNDPTNQKMLLIGTHITTPEKIDDWITETTRINPKKARPQC